MPKPGTRASPAAVPTPVTAGPSLARGAARSHRRRRMAKRENGEGGHVHRPRQSLFTPHYWPFTSPLHPPSPPSCDTALTSAHRRLRRTHRGRAGGDAREVRRNVRRWTREVAKGGYPQRATGSPLLNLIPSQNPGPCVMSAPVRGPVPRVQSPRGHANLVT